MSRKILEGNSIISVLSLFSLGNMERLSTHTRAFGTYYISLVVLRCTRPSLPVRRRGSARLSFCNGSTSRHVLISAHLCVT